MDHQIQTSVASTGAITMLAASKMVLGVTCIIAPRFACRLFLLKLPAGGAIAGRLFGSSCAAFGGLTWAASKSASEGRLSSLDLKTVLAANVVADSVDTISCLVGYTAGMYGLSTLGLLGGGCTALAALGALGFTGTKS
ncbi:hypothetical protein BFJ72_g14792 [Fusarium proliferatum]|uniref:Uncharacterized protein n=1 Tax=Gibberella intermedia TaxID=948311 RepID=A0A365MTE4_GIBIN|nr:hypothetical protein FPRO03_14180 [Fusarium proliferatum]RBA11809.1 hypothetical protein FPRO05_14197 [Fusarium proliferatum]RKL22016.1 hypothetical protein BFJ72_g14792 [Fusarium proliferatum]